MKKSLIPKKSKKNSIHYGVDAYGNVIAFVGNAKKLLLLRPLISSVEAISQPDGTLKMALECVITATSCGRTENLLSLRSGLGRKLVKECLKVCAENL